MAQLRIRVGAVLDRSFDVVFANAEARGRRAAQNISKSFNAELAKIGRGAPGGSAGGIGGTRGGFTRNLEAEAQRRADAAHIRAVRDAARLEAYASTASLRERLRNERAVERARITSIQRARRLDEANSRRELQNFAQRTSHRTTRFLTPNAPIASMATRGLSDVARGLGVDFSISGAVGRNVQLETLATKVSNSGYLPNAAEGNRNRQRVDPRELISEARVNSDTYGVDAIQSLEALQKFAGILGDLATGRELMADLTRLAAATGTEFGDMAAAAANVGNQLEDTPDKAKRIYSIMRMVAGQGKVGSVEIEDMATQMARVAANARFFSGDAGENITKLGALAQIARKTGGSPSAAEASRSVVAFADTLKKPERVNAFMDLGGKGKKRGVDVFTDASRTTLKDPLQLIKESLRITGGDLVRMNTAWKSTIGGRAVSGFSTAYNEAGGGAKGEAAVQEIWDSFTKGAEMGEKEIAASVEARNNTAEAKAARFQNKLDEITDKVMTKLIPALGLAIAASIARAGIESALRTGIERAIMGAGGAVGGAGGSMGAIGGVGVAMTLASLTVTSMVIGTALIDTLVERTKKAQDDQRGYLDKLDSWVSERKAKAANGEALSPQEVADLQKKRAELEEAIPRAERRRNTPEAIVGAVDFISGLLGDAERAGVSQQNQASLESLKEILNGINETLKRGTRITNPGDIAAAMPSGQAITAPLGIRRPDLPGGN
jgi:hypothetical protein